MRNAVLNTQLKFVELFAYLWLYVQFSIQQGYESQGRERDMFWSICEKNGNILWSEHLAQVATLCSRVSNYTNFNYKYSILRIW